MNKNNFFGVCVLFVILFVVSGCVVKPPAVVSGFCSSDADCVPDACCHAVGCVSKDQAPQCDDVFCTMECREGTLDCGGYCTCENNKCVAVYAEFGI